MCVQPWRLDFLWVEINSCNWWKKTKPKPNHEEHLMKCSPRILGLCLLNKKIVISPTFVENVLPLSQFLKVLCILWTHSNCLVICSEGNSIEEKLSFKEDFFFGHYSAKTDSVGLFFQMIFFFFHLVLSSFWHVKIFRLLRFEEEVSLVSWNG